MIDAAIIHRLNAINKQFYHVIADEFDATRNSFWDGWHPIIPYIHTPQLHVLDIGCGNGRFALFLNQYLANVPIQYHGIDNNDTLLKHAEHDLQSINNLTFSLQNVDIISNPPEQGTYDLVVLFGLMHHVPGYANRQQFIQQMAQRVKPDGLLVFACWRFYEFERFTKRLTPWPDDLVNAVEKHDYLLDWRRGEVALRYCHYVDDEEHAALIKSSGLQELKTYRADGFTGTVNQYSILMNV